MKSNAIVLVKILLLWALALVNKIDLIVARLQFKKQKISSTKIKSCIAASDAFFPFADGLKSLINAGVKIVVQPGGSIRDNEVINEARKRKIKMIFTGTRHF